MRTVVLDTNVLLSDPEVLLSFRDDEVVIPETVLGELDKLKTSRVDPDLRFRGREVSRLLFELSEQGSLVDGVDLPDGGRMRVAPSDTEGVFPEELSPKNADDRILAVAVQLKRRGNEDLVLVTNDLNMLLKAQTLGVQVERRNDGADGGWARRYIIRPFQRYKVPLGILAVALAVFAAIIVLSIYNPITANSRATIPQEFRDQLTQGQMDVLDQLTTLQRNPNDTVTEIKLANTYFNLAQQGHINNAQYAQYAVLHYQNVLRLTPDNFDVRTDMAVMEFQFLGETDQAIQDTVYVLRKQPNHLQANFNLGIFYWQGRHDYQAAESQFTKVIGLTKNDATQTAIYKDALARLAAVKKEAASGGKSTSTTTGTTGVQ
jgi:tetratricopeptide (TPR) repeat protein